MSKMPRNELHMQTSVILYAGLQRTKWLVGTGSIAAPRWLRNTQNEHRFFKTELARPCC